MNQSIVRALGCFTVASILSVGAQAQLTRTAETHLGTFVTPQLTPGAVYFELQRPAGDLRLNIATPEGEVLTRSFAAGTMPQFFLNEKSSDGIYRWEVRDTGPATAESLAGSPAVASGNFVVEGGSVTVPSEEPLPPDEQIIAEDLYVTGHLAIGNSIAGTEVLTGLPFIIEDIFIRMLFTDTSAGGNTRDWAILINDFAGDDYFAVFDLGQNTQPFTIRGGAPTSAMYVADSGFVGLGTSVPTSALHIVTPGGTNAAITMSRDDGATGVMSAAGSIVSMGATSDHPVQLLAGTGGQAGWKMKLFQDQSLSMRSGATCTTGGVWTDNAMFSSQHNVRPLATSEALQTLKGLNPIRFESAGSPGEQHVGFTAEEAPDMVVNSDRTGMSPMDVAAVLTKVVQEQQRTIEALEARLAELEHRAGQKSQR